MRADFRGRPRILHALPLCGAALLAVSACRGGAPSTTAPAAVRSTATAPPPSAAAPGTAHHSPLSQRELRTTSGAIALGNLDSEIGQLERDLTARPDDPALLMMLVERLTTRAICRGRIADYERAAALAEHAAAVAPGNPAVYLTRAHARASLHRFADAEADLAEAQRRGAPTAAVDALRANFMEETGRLDEALALSQRQMAQPDIFNLGAEAALRARRGEVDAAERLFTEAQYQYRDVSPLPYAWLYLQQGLMWSRAGNDDRARVLWLAALERIPGYAPAIGHLAALEARAGRSERAIDLLQPLAESSDDPEYWGQLAALYRASGRVPEADALRARAAQRFDDLVARYPAAFSAKAARFWLADGRDPDKALALARGNFQVRQTADDRALLAEAEAAAASATR